MNVIAAIFDLPVSPMSESVHTNPAVLLKTGNVAAFFCDVSAKGGGAPPIISRTGMRFSLNGRVSKLNFDDVQWMTVFEPEIKMAAIKRKKV